MIHVTLRTPTLSAYVCMYVCMHIYMYDHAELDDQMLDVVSMMSVLVSMLTMLTTLGLLLYLKSNCL
jgi:hypothetical protein